MAIVLKRKGMMMKQVIDWLIGWPERTSRYFEWLAPLFARIVCGYEFMLSGWGKLNNLPQITENFIGWGIPFPHVLTPFVSGIEFFGGIFLHCYDHFYFPVSGGVAPAAWPCSPSDWAA